jgi:hypothetical protein
MPYRGDTDCPVHHVTCEQVKMASMNGAAKSPSEQKPEAPSTTEGAPKTGGAAEGGAQAAKADRVCATCCKPATMACPKCLELKLPTTLFCSQVSHCHVHRHQHLTLGICRRAPCSS